jgi:photosystem II stability/assembly factor-like uncharacterized protein
MIKITIFITCIYVLLSNNVCLLSQNAESYNSDCNLWLVTESFSQRNTAAYSQENASVWLQVQSPVTSQIMGLIFLDSMLGWASHTGMGVMKTTNSGANWETTSFNDTTFTTAFNGIHFINSNTGWSVGGALQIRKTTNGGVNWVRQVPPPAAGILRSVYFIDANTGYAMGSKNFPYVPFICKTANGGDSWIEISPTFAGAQELNEQYWFNASTGWLCGYDVLLYTTNGGANFTNLYSNVPPSNNGHTSLLSIYFTDQQTGWLGAANLERSNVYKTTNGGANWFFQNNPISQGGMNQINDVRFINSNLGWAVHGTPSSGAIMYTTNGGTNWAIEEQSVNWFDCLAIYSDRKAWCGSSSGKIWYTTPDIPVSVTHTEETVSEFTLHQNFPNPFNPVTSIKFQLAKSVIVKLVVYDITGREIAELVNRQLSSGTHEVKWDAFEFPSGIYYYKVSADEFTETKKMILVK